MLKPKELSYSELKRKAYTDEYTAFLCGSDQVWNSSVFYVDPFYYLQFAPKSKRIAFALSFGREYIPDYNRKTIAKYLVSIPHKSVREASGVDIVRDLTGDDAKVLLDPTIVLTPEEWKEGLNIKEIKNDKYILAYFLDAPSPLALQTVERISNQFGLKIINLLYCSNNQIWQEIPAGPKEFIGLVSGASFVCTDSFDDIKFRSKVHGWHEYAFDFIKNGKTTHSKKINDPFYELFFAMNIMNDACYDCVARSSVEKTDLRIGDFWGWQFDTDRKGVSAVVTVTPKGKELFQSVKDRFVTNEFDFNDVIAAQSYGKIHVINQQKRRNTLLMLKGDSDIKELQKQHRKSMSIASRVKRVIKNVLKRLPQSVYLCMKSIFHRKTGGI